MSGHEVEHDLDPARVRLFDEPIDVTTRAEVGVDVTVIRDVVTPVGIGGRVDRIEPDPTDA
jgi:hypothetical protein